MVSEKLEEVAQLCRRFRVAKLEVFGSAARGEFVPGESDVDLLVEFVPGEWEGAADRWFGLKDALIDLFGCDVDLVSLRALDNYVLKAEIEATKGLVYAA